LRSPLSGSLKSAQRTVEVNSFSPFFATHRKGKISENELTSIVRRAGYRFYTEDLKTDPERRLPKECFEPFWTFLA